VTFSIFVSFCEKTKAVRADFLAVDGADWSLFNLTDQDRGDLT